LAPPPQDFPERGSNQRRFMMADRREGENSGRTRWSSASSSPAGSS